jgi:Mrp family chromosome partitioning ATPase
VGFVLGKEDPVIGDASSSGQIIRQTLQDVDWGNEAEIMLIDLLLGTGEPQQTLLTAGLIDAVLLVTTPQDLSWLDGGTLSRSVPAAQRTAAGPCGEYGVPRMPALWRANRHRCERPE